MYSTANSLLQCGEIEVLARDVVFADHFEKFECARVPGSLAWAQRTEYLADGPVLVGSGHRDQHSRRMVAKRLHKAGLLFGSQPSYSQIRCTETLHQLCGKQLHQGMPIFFVRFDNLRQRRATKRFQPQKAGTARGASLSLQASRIVMGKSERT